MLCSVSLLECPLEDDMIVNSPFAIALSRKIFVCGQVIKITIGEIRPEVREVNIPAINKRSIVAKIFYMPHQERKFLSFRLIFYNTCFRLCRITAENADQIGRAHV